MSDRRWVLVIVVLALIGVAASLWVAWPRTHPGPPPAVRWEMIAPPAGVAIRPWQWIIIHHSGEARGDARGIDRTHKEDRGWDGIGYDFVIGNGDGMPEGRIEATFRWRNQEAGAHAGVTTYNEQGIGICLIGDYRAVPPSAYAADRVAELCALLISRVPGLAPERIIGHGSVPGKVTACPGASFDIQALRAAVRRRLGPTP